MKDCVKECKSCMFYQQTSGLMTDSPAGLCMVGSQPMPTFPGSGLNCSAWQAMPLDFNATRPMRPSDYSVLNITEDKKLAYQLPNKPVRTQIQEPPASTVKVGDIIKISWPDEWVVSAIGRASLLAFNPKTGIEKSFSLKDTSIQKER